MDIISYNEIEMESPITKYVSRLKDFNDFEPNPKVTRLMTQLSHKYNKYAGFYEFPEKFKGLTIIFFLKMI